MLCGKYHCTFIGINQLRDDMNSAYGGQTTPGGKAWKHHCSLRIEFRKGSLLDDKYKEVPKKTENPFGNVVAMQIKKTKVCKPDRLQGNYTLIYDYGIDEIHDLIDICVTKDVISKAGAWFTFVHPTTGEVLTNAQGETYKAQGENGVRKALESDDKLLHLYRSYVDNLIAGHTDNIELEEYDVYDEDEDATNSTSDTTQV